MARVKVEQQFQEKVIQEKERKRIHLEKYVCHTGITTSELDDQIECNKKDIIGKYYDSQVVNKDTKGDVGNENVSKHVNPNMSALICLP